MRATAPIWGCSSASATRGDHGAAGRPHQNARGDHARHLGIAAPPRRGRSGARGAARAPRWHGCGERPPLHRAQARSPTSCRPRCCPRRLPEIPGVHTRALYRAAGELNEVGGDFYDVCDTGAAAGCWRSATCAARARAPRVPRRSRVTRCAPPRCSARARRESCRRFTTRCDCNRRARTCARPAWSASSRVAGAAKLTVTLGGHPPPVLISAAGEPQQVGRPGTLLGVLEQVKVSETSRGDASRRHAAALHGRRSRGGRSDRQLGERRPAGGVRAGARTAASRSCSSASRRPPWSALVVGCATTWRCSAYGCPRPPAHLK